ncbi:MAG: helix-turn-helix domain-containing protein [Anaerolineales bacterium]
MTLSNWFARTFGIEARNVPNDFTIAMGKKVKKARLEAGLSQSELGEKAYFHQASISQIESGKREVTSMEIISLSFSLSKSIMYFYPDQIQKYFKIMPTDLEELLLVCRKLDNGDLKRLLVQARALAKDS